jgi:nucleotide-binding universal stress UspA family protein
MSVRDLGVNPGTRSHRVPAVSQSAYTTVVVGTDGSESSLRLLGSVPADATRRSECDVLVVHTTG